MDWEEVKKILNENYNSNEKSLASIAIFICHYIILWGTRVGDFTNLNWNKFDEIKNKFKLPG